MSQLSPQRRKILAYHDHTGLGGSLTGDLGISLAHVLLVDQADILGQRGPK
jgi:hypothetical protein